MERAKGNSDLAKTYLLAVIALGLAISSPPVIAQTAVAPTAGVAGERIKRVVLVSIPDRKLAVLEGGEIIATFPIAVGATGSPSPTGEFQIVNRVANPTYYHPG